MNKKQMFLYVWEGVLTDYADGIMFAVAPTVEDAKKAIMARDNVVCESHFITEPRVFDLTESVGFALWGGG